MALVRRPGRRRHARRPGRLIGLGLLLAASLGAAGPPAGAVAPARLDTFPGPADGPLFFDPTIPIERDGWLVDSGLGLVRWRPVGERNWRPLWVGRVLPYGSEVEAEAGARAALAGGGTRLTVQGGGRVVLPRPGAGAARLVRQDRGRVRYRVDPGAPRAPRTGSALAVIAPALVATVKGTVFDLDIGDGTAELRVASGLVAVAPHRRSAEGGAPDTVEVAAGEGFRVAATAGGPARGRLFRFDDAPVAGGAPSWLAAAAVAAILSALLAAGAVLFVVGRRGPAPGEGRRRPRPR